MDRDEKLARLKKARETAAAEKLLADQIRDELITELRDEGVVFFIDEQGVKRRAYYSESDLTEIDLDALAAAVRKRKVPKAVFNDVTKTVVNTERLKAAIATGRIPTEVVAETMKVIPGGKSKTIKFGDPSDAASASSPDTR